MCNAYLPFPLGDKCVKPFSGFTYLKSREGLKLLLHSTDRDEEYERRTRPLGHAQIIQLCLKKFSK